MPAYFDFTVSLQDVLPRPWRRFLIPRTGSFADLHDAIQAAAGWASSHLYEFRAASIGDTRPIAGLALDHDLVTGEKPVADAARVPLSSWFGPQRSTTCLYWYDFGDDWQHDVQLNDLVQRPERFRRRLLGGEHPFPPDDCGGPGMYLEIQKAVHTGKDPEGYLDWARDVWGWTGHFDIEAVRARFEARSKR